ncbi:oxygen-dependent protoporphyrinogen oxidase [Maudiozyma humilis]|uniref:Protoporphyrinogen oxidase n=1 Tax=Maudiozyma humilis TaxID=51915 RepID=A0AAV5RXV9_MAUHU|nr:oxygen-dependent protoporphyrinogen oxidase [Kazachstania humilis]
MLSQLTKLPANARVGVVGGGVAGLTFTYFLGKLRPDVQITLFNPESRPGGWIHSWHTQGPDGRPVMLERGPRTFRGVSDGTVLILDTLMQLGHGDNIRSVSKDSSADRKFVLDPRDRLVQVPNSLGSLARFLASPLSKGLLWGLAGEWARKPVGADAPDESAEALLTRRFGSPYPARNLFSAVYRGIYADDVGRLSAQKAVGRMVRDERAHGSLTAAAWARWRSAKADTSAAPELSPLVAAYGRALGRDAQELRSLAHRLAQFPMLGLTGGLQQFPDAFQAAVARFPNVALCTGTVTGLRGGAGAGDKQAVALEYTDAQGAQHKGKFSHVRLAVAPNRMAPLVAGANAPLFSKLNAIRSNTVSLVNMYIPGKDIVPAQFRGFGYLVPESNANPEKLLGVIFDSVIEQSFAPFAVADGAAPAAPATAAAAAPAGIYTKLTAMVGGSLYNDAEGHPTIPSEAETIARVKRALSRHLGASPTDLDGAQWLHTVARDCLPQFVPGYGAQAAEIERAVLADYAQGVSLGGMGFARGPGIPDVVSDAFTDAMKLH